MDLSDSPENIALWFLLFFLKNLLINEAETSTGKFYYIHLSSLWVGIHVMAKKRDQQFM